MNYCVCSVERKHFNEPYVAYLVIIIHSWRPNFVLHALPLLLRLAFCEPRIKKANWGRFGINKYCFCCMHETLNSCTVPLLRNERLTGPLNWLYSQYRYTWVIIFQPFSGLNIIKLKRTIGRSAYNNFIRLRLGINTLIRLRLGLDHFLLF